MTAGCLFLFTVTLEGKAEVSLCANIISCENNNYLTNNALHQDYVRLAGLIQSHSIQGRGENS